MSETTALTYRELAAQLGITPDSARSKATRRKWQKIPGNHPSEPVRVMVPVEVLEAKRAPGAREGTARGADGLGDTRLIDALQAHIETLKQDRIRLEAEREAERADFKARIAQLEAGLNRERDGWREAECRVRESEAERTRLALEAERLRQPWWRRLRRGR